MLKDYFENSVGFYTVERLINGGQWQAGKVINPVLSLFLKKERDAGPVRLFLEPDPLAGNSPALPMATGRERQPFQSDRPASLVVAQRLRQDDGALGHSLPLGGLNNHVYRTHILKVRYDLTRILAEWHSRWIPGGDSWHDP